MNYDNFIVAIKEAVEELCPNDRVVAKKITKNNSMVMDSISIFRGEEYIAPTIYLEAYFEEFIQGKSIETIAKDIVIFSDMYRGRVELDLKMCESFEGVKDRVLCKVVNKEQNELILETCPHRDFFDLAVVYYCVEMSTDNEYGSWLITNAVFDEWKISEEELYYASVKNLKSQIDWEIVDIWDLLEEMTGECYDRGDYMENYGSPKMYVLTNSLRTFGASALLNIELLDEFAAKNGSFFILPSSIHELILVCKNNIDEAESYKKMVEEVNETQVPTMDFLSNSVYFYDEFEGLCKLTI
jgi:hypothetical protein